MLPACIRRIDWSNDSTHFRLSLALTPPWNSQVPNWRRHRYLVFCVSHYDWRAVQVPMLRLTFRDARLVTGITYRPRFLTHRVSHCETSR
jgi:hypothetical protein